jgi:hypothetical protein
MKKILFGLTVMAVLAAPFASEAWAGPRGGSAYTRTTASASAYRTTSRASVSAYRATSYVSASAYRSTSRASVSAYRATSYTSVPAYRATSNASVSTHRATTTRAYAPVNRATSYQRSFPSSSLGTRPAYSASRAHSGQYTNYHQTYGTKFAYGYFYRGRNHAHWSYQRWDSRYGCNCYYDPCCTCWYYWCEPVSCYYPVSYCPYRTYCWSTEVVEPEYTQPVAVQVPSSPSTSVPPATYPVQQPVSTPSTSNWEAPRTYTPSAVPEPMTPAVDE